jgi:hypothetical protein
MMMMMIMKPNNTRNEWVQRSSQSARQGIIVIKELTEWIKRGGKRTRTSRIEGKEKKKGICR